ncbi:shikimate kinase AroK [Ectothiorhodospiraceae bacterium BW-2]|nr:shikimate kinase AroK [Ectothiorhodospiraceae bacterium BW-2]
MMQQNIFLVGPMGAGKSTIGRQLAYTLNVPFRDCDHEIINRTGASIPLIFELEGEEGFRRRESEMLDELTQLSEVVMATGGGAVLKEQNRQLLRSRGVVIYLYASQEQLYQRTCRDRNRPLLQTDNPRQKIAELLEQRDPLYRQVADLIVHTEERSVRSVVKEVVARLRRELQIID